MLGRDATIVRSFICVHHPTRISPCLVGILPDASPLGSLSGAVGSDRMGISSIFAHPKCVHLGFPLDFPQPLLIHTHLHQLHCSPRPERSSQLSTLHFHREHVQSPFPRPLVALNSPDLAHSSSALLPLFNHGYTPSCRRCCMQRARWLDMDVAS